MALLAAAGGDQQAVERVDLAPRRRGGSASCRAGRAGAAGRSRWRGRRRPRSRARCAPLLVGDLDLVGLEDEVADGEHQAAAARRARRCRCAPAPSVSALRALASAFTLTPTTALRRVDQVLVGRRDLPWACAGAAVGAAAKAGSGGEQQAGDPGVFSSARLPEEWCQAPIS